MEKVESYLQKASGPNEISTRVHKVTAISSIILLFYKKALYEVCELLLAWNSPHFETIPNSLPGKLTTRSILSAPYEWFDLVEECKEVGVDVFGFNQGN